MREPNREIVGRLLYVSKYGRPEHRNAALSRLALIKAAHACDDKYTSNSPVLNSVETEAWTWWHQIEEAAASVAA
jgi:hypothetical protein